MYASTAGGGAIAATIKRRASKATPQATRRESPLRKEGTPDIAARFRRACAIKEEAPTQQRRKA